MVSDCLQQALKFVSLLNLSAVRRLVDVLDSSDAESGVVAIGTASHISVSSKISIF
jgi:hypothetical protein